jgi:hypothetical protein
METGTVSEQVMQQYKMMVDSAIQVTNWRHSANNFYLSVNTALLSIAAYLYNFSSGTGIVIGLIGLATIALWYEMIQYYRSLNKAKFSVIHEIEKQLPVAIYKLEEDHFVKENRKKATSIESKIPILFGVAYMLIITVHILKIVKII